MVIVLVEDSVGAFRALGSTRFEGFGLNLQITEFRTLKAHLNVGSTLSRMEAESYGVLASVVVVALGMLLFEVSFHTFLTLGALLNILFT